MSKNHTREHTKNRSTLHSTHIYAWYTNGKACFPISSNRSLRNIDNSWKEKTSLNILEKTSNRACQNAGHHHSNHHGISSWAYYKASKTSITLQKPRILQTNQINTLYQCTLLLAIEGGRVITDNLGLEQRVNGFVVSDGYKTSGDNIPASRERISTQSL